MIKKAEREKKTLVKSNLLEAFNNEFDKMIRLGALVELKDTEIKQWDGPKHYTALQKKILKYTNDEYDHFLCFLGR